jgi:Ca2+-binding EF-hand superfamily protein
MNKEKFIEVYGLLYPNGNAQKFSKQVFRVFDRNNSGLIDFKELMLSISVTTAGDLRKKIELAFTLFDLNQNGLIEEKEMITIIEAIFELLDYDSQKRTGINSAKERVKCIIQQLDKDNDNCLSKEEFIEGCMNDPVIRQLLVPVS